MKLAIPLFDKLPFRELGLKAQSLLPSGRNRETLKRVDASLLLFDHTLINTENGKTEEVTNAADEAQELALARAARRLLPAGQDNRHILLMLPTTEFATTSYQMQIMGEKMIRSALELQSHTLIPAYDEKLLLAVNASKPEGVALWFSEKQINRLFRAFEEQGMFLSAIMPRSLALLENTEDEDRSILINDEEGSNVSLLQITGNTIRRLLTVNKADLEQDVFAKQWDIETSQLKANAVQNVSSLDDWSAIRQRVSPVVDYCFLPAGAIEEEKKISFARKSKAALAIAAGIVLMLFAPFIANWMTLRDLQAELARVEEMSIEPRSLQASIFDMDEEWGALEEYPDQKVAQVLISLNDVVQSSLTSFSMNKGVIDISGSTDDPAYLVELLAQREEFFNVAQSTNTRGGGAQFGIRMNLSSTDFEAYEEKYPVISQGR